MGLRDVDPSTPRIFVWSVNSTREIDAAERLLAALRGALKGAPRLRLLVLVNFQRQPGFLRLKGGTDILFRRMHESLYGEGGRHWSMRLQCEAYSEAIAEALRLWAGAEGAPEAPQVEDLAGVCAACDAFDGGNPATELFVPRRFHGQAIMLGAAQAVEGRIGGQSIRKASDDCVEDGAGRRAGGGVGGRGGR